jgi:hypothetical protein
VPPSAPRSTSDCILDVPFVGVTDPAGKKIANLNINTYMDQAKDAVTLLVDFSSLPDGTNYAEKTVLTAAAKQIVATTISTNYHVLGAM